MSATGSASQLVLNLCLELGATQYLSGVGAKSYLDEAAFREAGVEIIYRAPALPASYPQLHAGKGFMNDLSAIDTILNCGPEWRTFLFPAVRAVND